MDSKIMNYTKKLFFSIDRNILGFDYAGYTNVDIWSFFLSKDKIEKDKNAWNECFYCASEKIPVEKLKLEETLHEY